MLPSPPLAVLPPAPTNSSMAFCSCLVDPRNDLATNICQVSRPPRNGGLQNPEILIQITILLDEEATLRSRIPEAYCAESVRKFPKLRRPWSYCRRELSMS